MGNSGKIKIKKIVSEGYGKIARGGGASCCSGGAELAGKIGKKVGYSEKDLAGVPSGANLGLGCGNPLALASIKEGDTVLDLGSGAGVDCFIAAEKVGPGGRVIGVDMTPEMLERARENAKKGGYNNVEFRSGDIESLPVEDGTVDLIISNCVINLAPDKGKVFGEAFRVLRTGGRLMVSDIVLLKELPRSIRDSAEAYVGCISGASMRGGYLKAVEDAGFRDVRVESEALFPLECMANDPTAQALAESLKFSEDEMNELASSIASITVSAVKRA